MYIEMWKAIRLIPARAGKTCLLMGGSSPVRAHLRACGENGIEDAKCVSRLGSSPRVRGKREEHRRDLRDPRLIPARAGKTVRRWASGTATRAHPRACGENEYDDQGGPSRFGSSPRVRGKLYASGFPKNVNGLIPARAGKTTPATHTTSARRAHPRACGENAMSVSSKPAIPGSSPRVRGKPGRWR